jgi:hypothetical protein
MRERERERDREKERERERERESIAKSYPIHLAFYIDLTLTFSSWSSQTNKTRVSRIPGCCMSGLGLPYGYIKLR